MSLNIKYPIEDDVNKNNYLSVSSTTKDAISSNLMLLMLTEKGYRYYMPDYGTYLIKYMFEPNDNITIKDVENDLKSTIEKYLPEIELLELRHDRLEENDNIISAVYSYNGGTYTGAEQLQISF
ncbi:MAG: GPW/gp25 family protein [bacterium]